MAQQVGNPFAVFDVCLASRHHLHRLGIDQDNGKILFKDELTSNDKSSYISPENCYKLIHSSYNSYSNNIFNDGKSIAKIIE